MKKIVFLAILMTVMLIMDSYSATWDKAKGIGVSISAIKPKGGNIDQGAIGSMYGGNIKFGLSPYTMVSIDASYGAFQPLKGGSGYEPDKNSPFETTVIPIHLSLRVNPFGDSSIKPYVLFGAGVMLWDLKNSDTSVHGQQTDFGYAMGLGFEWFLAQWLGLDFLVRSNSYPTLEKDNVGYGEDNNNEFIEPRLTLNLYWGQKIDSDKDGILDKFDLAPLQPEDFDGFQDHDGAPDPDNDNDGIVDTKDQAPLSPEDKDGFQDEDGIPDYDNDQDGIKDVDDGAPNEPEDKDGFQDNDGVPDIDNDNDGISDANDKCPDQPETINGYQDEDGCPDVKPMPVLEKVGAALILEGINFKTGSADLTEESSATLDKIVKGLLDNPEVEIEIRGYTDNVGRAQANQQLSEKRAQAVRRYLVDKGVDSSRISAVGLGENDPVASNNTPEGRAQNRRIEFFRIK